MQHFSKKRKQKDEAKEVPKKKAKVQHQTDDDGESDTPGIATVSGKVVHGNRTQLSADDNSDVTDDRTEKPKKLQERKEKTTTKTKKNFQGTDSPEKLMKNVKHNKNSKKAKNDDVDKGKGNIEQQKKQRKIPKQAGKSISKKKDEGSYTKGVHVPQQKQALDMSAWSSLAIPNPVLQALQDMGFTKPTPIQSACIPAAIKQHKDIMGAAETGSGKTLAFGIPILHHILKLQEQQQQDNHGNDSTGDEGIKEVNDEEISAEKDSDGLSDQLESDMEEEEDSDDVDDDDDDDDDKEEEEDGEGEEEEEEEILPKGQSQDQVEEKSSGGDLLALIMAPTRELAVQVKNHLVAAAKYTSIKIAVVVGGISAEKQQRLLKKKPEIVVGTPGRLWELISEREPHLSTMPHIRYLVIDEADRMVERGHYMELSNIMDLLNGSHMQKKRQTFIFSATLTMVHVGPRTQKPNNNPKQKDKTKLDTVLSKVQVRQNAKVVDLTSKEGTVATLLEGKIVCNLSEKDIYLYYFLLQYPGRTLVFTNSIECIRHMVSILTLLQCNPLPLHSSMHQRQRLKNLDRFAANPRGLLIATDVAARGLDIPNVQHVIHYHVPKTSEIYVHRSGRTARQAKEGLSIMLVSAKEVKSFRKVCKSLNRTDLPNFPTELKFYEAVKDRISLAREVDKLELSMTKKKKQNQWYENAAKELDVDLDDWVMNDIGSDAEQKQHSAKVKQLRGELKSLLKSRIFPRWSSQLYPTLDGALVQPFAASDSAAAMSSFKTRMRKDKEEDDARKEKKRRKFQRFKRNRKFKAQSAKSP